MMFRWMGRWRKCSIEEVPCLPAPGPCHFARLALHPSLRVVPFTIVAPLACCSERSSRTTRDSHLESDTKGHDLAAVRRNGLRFMYDKGL